jgi:hypothetical protein
MKLHYGLAPLSIAVFVSLPTLSAFASSAETPLSSKTQVQAPVHEESSESSSSEEGAMQTKPSTVHVDSTKMQLASSQQMPLVMAEVVKEEEAHKQRLKVESESQPSRASQWGPRVWWNKLCHKWSKGSEYAEEKKIIDQNLGGFEPSLHAYAITTCAASLMEKHYADVASFKLGASYMREMQVTMLPNYGRRNDMLQDISARCKKSLEGYKADKKNSEIKRTKVFSYEQKMELDAYLGRLYESTPAIIPLLQKAYDSTLDCHNPKGFTVGVAFGLGGYGGVYRQKCKSPLGQRYSIKRIHGGPAAGFGGVGTMSFLGLNFSRDHKEPNHSRPFHARLDGNVAGAAVAGYGLDVTASGGVLKKAGQSEADRKQNISEPTIVAAPATGFGAYAGIGVEFDWKTNLNEPDFDSLFVALGFYPQSVKTVKDEAAEVKK